MGTIMGSQDTATAAQPSDPSTGSAPAPGPAATAPPPSPQPRPAQARSDIADFAALQARRLTEAQVRYPGGIMRTGSTRPSSPRGAVSTRVLDHMLATRDELEHARAARPVSPAGAAMYEWINTTTPHLDAGAQRAIDVMVYRQGLEHALQARDTSVIRRHRCPSCRCWSLVWRWQANAAVCVNRYDLGDDGRPRRVPLDQIAEEAVENLTIRAAT